MAAPPASTYGCCCRSPATFCESPTTLRGKSAPGRPSSSARPAATARSGPSRAGGTATATARSWGADGRSSRTRAASARGGRVRRRRGVAPGPPAPRRRRAHRQGVRRQRMLQGARHSTTCRWLVILAFHGITEANALLLRYEGNMVFTVEVFEPDGCQRESKHKEVRDQQTSSLPDLEKQQEAPSPSIQKRKRTNMASLWRNSSCKIGPPSWIKKKINADTLERELALATGFCDVIGLREPCTITLKASMNGTESWQVCGFPCNNRSYLLVEGWRKFCQENSLKEGNICSFNIVETRLWHVVITRCKEKINQLCYQDTPSTSSSERKSKKSRSSNEEQRRTKVSMTSLNKASSMTQCVFEIGPPAWIQKEINASTIEKQLCLPLSFCEAIGLREVCMITLKTSTSSTMSWQAHVVPYKNCNHLLGSGWKRFCHENGIKVGDVCTIKIIETMLWHVHIGRR